MKNLIFAAITGLAIGLVVALAYVTVTRGSEDVQPPMKPGYTFSTCTLPDWAVQLCKEPQP